MKKTVLTILWKDLQQEYENVNFKKNKSDEVCVFRVGLH